MLTFRYSQFFDPSRSEPINMICCQAYFTSKNSLVVPIISEQIQPFHFEDSLHSCPAVATLLFLLACSLFTSSCLLRFFFPLAPKIISRTSAPNPGNPTTTSSLLLEPRFSRRRLDEPRSSQHLSSIPSHPLLCSHIRISRIEPQHLQ